MYMPEKPAPMTTASKCCLALAMSSSNQDVRTTDQAISLLVQSEAFQQNRIRRPAVRRLLSPRTGDLVQHRCARFTATDVRGGLRLRAARHRAFALSLAAIR